MSARKKKTETLKKNTLTDKSYRVRIDPTLMGRRVYGRSPLDVEMESEDAIMAREYRELRIDEMNLKRRAKMAKLQKEIDKLEKETEKKEEAGAVMPGISIAMARQISMLPREEQDKIMQTYAAFRSIDQSKGRGDSILPLLVGFSKTNPGTAQSDMATYAKAMADQFKTGIDAMKAVMPPKDKASNPMEFMKIMKDLVIEGVRNPLLQAIEKSQPQPGIFEQILTHPDLYNRAKEIGMFGSREPATAVNGPIALEIEKLKGERELSMKKMDLEWRKDSLERDAADRRTDTIISIFGPLAGGFAASASQKMQELGQQQASAHNPTHVVPPSETIPVVPPRAPENQVLIRCSCGHEGVETFQGAVPPASFNCPQCGQILLVGDSYSGGKTEGTDTGLRG